MTNTIFENPRPRLRPGRDKANVERVPPPMDDADSILDAKFSDYLPCHLITALQNAGVETIGELKAWAHSDRFRMTKNIGPVGRDHVRSLLSEAIDSGLGFSVRAERGTMQNVAQDLCETTSQARVDWFRSLGKHLREAGCAHSIVDDLEAYSE